MESWLLAEPLPGTQRRWHIPLCIVCTNELGKRYRVPLCKRNCYTHTHLPIGERPALPPDPQLPPKGEVLFNLCTEMCIFFGKYAWKPL